MAGVLCHSSEKMPVHQQYTCHHNAKMRIYVKNNECVQLVWKCLFWVGAPLMAQTECDMSVLPIPVQCLPEVWRCTTCYMQWPYEVLTHHKPADSPPRLEFEVYVQTIFGIFVQPCMRPATTPTTLVHHSGITRGYCAIATKLGAPT